MSAQKSHDMSSQRPQRTKAPLNARVAKIPVGIYIGNNLFKQEKWKHFFFFKKGKFKYFCQVSEKGGNTWRRGVECTGNITLEFSNLFENLKCFDEGVC